MLFRSHRLLQLEDNHPIGSRESIKARFRKEIARLHDELATSNFRSPFLQSPAPDPIIQRIHQLRKIKELFDKHFAAWRLHLPEDDLDAHDPNKVVRIIDSESGWLIFYRFGFKRGMWYLDYYSSHRMTSDSHIRLWQDGSSRSMPAAPPGLVYKDNDYLSSRRARLQSARRNKRVRQLLRLKGFYDDDGPRRFYTSWHRPWPAHRAI